MKRIYNVNDNFFASWNNDMAYVLGLITAYGCIKQGRRVNICIKDLDRDVLEYVKNVTGFTGQVNTYMMNKRTMADITITSPKMCEDLMQLNVTSKKTYNIVTPDNLPTRYTSHYVRGVFDGDGGISTWMTKTSKLPTCECTIDSASAQFAEQVLSYITDNGVNARIYVKKSKIPNRIPMNRIRMCGESVVDFGSFIYTNAPFYMKRKYDKFLEYCRSRMASCQNCGNIYYKSRTGHNLCGSCV